MFVDCQVAVCCCFRGRRTLVALPFIKVSVNDQPTKRMRFVMQRIRSSSKLPTQDIYGGYSLVGGKCNYLRVKMVGLIFVNDLISDLNSCSDKGVKLTSQGKINCLFFADDIVLFADNEADLHSLLNTANSFFQKWKLKMNLSKSKFLSTPGYKLSSEMMEKFCMKEVTKGYYKYLGVPFDSHGINASTYFEKIKQEFRKSLFAVSNMCHHHNIPEEQRIIYYKTTIRSKIEYAAQIIPFTDHQIEELEELQILALRTLMNSVLWIARPATILAAFNLETIQSRFDILKICFFHKLSQAHGTMANQVLQYVMQLPSKPVKVSLGSKELIAHRPFHSIIRSIMSRYGKDLVDGMYTLHNHLDYESVKQLISKRVAQYTKASLCKQITTFNMGKNLKKHSFPTDKSPLEDLLQSNIIELETCQIDFRGPLSQQLQYIPIPAKTRIDRPRFLSQFFPRAVEPHKYEIWRYLLMQNDHLPTWKQWTVCPTCGTKCDKTSIHAIFQCEKTTQERLIILNNLYTDLKPWAESLSDSFLFEQLASVIEQGCTLSSLDYRKCMEYMMMPQLDHILDREVTSVIRSYVILLTATLVPHFQGYKTIHSVTTLGDEPVKQKISHNDFLSNSRFVWRLTSSGVTIDTASSFTYYDEDSNIPYLGSATDRRSDPILTARAHKYATKVIESHPNKLHIFTDGSVRGPKQHRVAGSGYAIIAEETKITGMYSPDTTSIAVAEFSAIDKALQHLKTLPNTKDTTLFCDNKYVVAAINNTHTTNKVHKDILHSIQQHLFNLRQSYSVNVVWIPAHCNIKHHDLADRLAVEAAGGPPASP